MTHVDLQGGNSDRWFLMLFEVHTVSSLLFVPIFHDKSHVNCQLSSQSRVVCTNVTVQDAAEDGEDQHIISWSAWIRDPAAGDRPRSQNPRPRDPLSFSERVFIYCTECVLYIKTLSEKDKGSRGLGFWDRGLSPAAGSRIHALHENYPWSSPSSRPLLRPASCAVTFVHTVQLGISGLT